MKREADWKMKKQTHWFGPWMDESTFSTLVWDFLFFVSLILTFPIYHSHLCFPQDGGDDEAPVRVLMKADPSCRESLQAEAEVDPMDGEQTWPTESELLEAEGAEREFTRNSILKWCNW